MVRVFPGCLLTLAKFFRFNKQLINEDFPTFDRPAKANSGRNGLGRSLISTMLLTKLDFVIFNFITGNFKIFNNSLVNLLNGIK